MAAHCKARDQLLADLDLAPRSALLGGEAAVADPRDDRDSRHKLVEKRPVARHPSRRARPSRDRPHPGIHCAVTTQPARGPVLVTGQSPRRDLVHDGGIGLSGSAYKE